MYRIQASAPVALRLSGMPASDVNVSITPGYNWFGYTGTQALSIEDLIVSPGPSEGDRIIDKEDVSVTFTNGAWNGEFTLVPGKGYIYVSSGTENKTIFIP